MRPLRTCCIAATFLSSVLVRPTTGHGQSRGQLTVAVPASVPDAAVDSSATPADASGAAQASSQDSSIVGDAGAFANDGGGLATTAAEPVAADAGTDAVPESVVGMHASATPLPTTAPPGGPAAPHADTHAAHPPATVAAEFGQGVTVTAPNDAFALTIRARVQARFTLLGPRPDAMGVYPMAAPGTEFLIRRMRLVLQGHVFNRTWQYYVQLGLANRDMEPDLLMPVRDAYITWTGLRDLNVRIGQMKVPFGLQRVVSSSALQFVDRSLAVGELNLDRDVGIQFLSQDVGGLGGRLRYHLGLFGGDGRNRLSDVFGLLYVARVQYLPFGRFDDLAEADFDRSATPRLAIGVAAAYNHQTNRPQSTIGTPLRFARFDYLHMAADLTFRYQGFSFQAEVLYRNSTSGGVVTRTLMDPMMTVEREFSRSGWGYYVQAAMMLTRNLEVGARWGEVFAIRQSTVVGEFDSRQFDAAELGGVASWYFQRHSMKLQLDYFALLGNAPGGNYPAYAGTQHQVRMQFQLYF